jgi:hypothetical protein
MGTGQVKGRGKEGSEGTVATPNFWTRMKIL